MIGKTISHYKILEKLGEGGMGVVYKAEDTKLKRPVALKFLPSNLTQDPEAKQRFIKEAQAASTLQHANICTIHEINETDDGQLFISMEYLDGKTLKEKIKKDTLTIEETVEIITQIARGLEKAHKKGIVHRDIKPANIIITDDGVAKIVDFGLAKLAGQTKLTKTGSTLGTVAYMSPEQTQGTVVDHRTDIWALGVIMYEMCSGEHPFKGDYEQAVMYSILNEEPAPISDSRSEIPNSIEQVVAKALEKDPDERYQNAVALLDDLKSISAGIVPEEIKIRLRKARLLKRKKIILCTISAGLIITTAIVLSFWTRRARVIDSIAVLPLENLTGKAEQEYFVDGITDELIGHLGQISGLSRVISRTSVMRYKETDFSLTDIARELNVDAVVEGTVYQVGDSIRIRLQLIDVLPEEQNLWGETYARPMRDVLMLYGEVARIVASEINIGLTQQEETRFAETRLVNSEAYDAYLKGMFHWQRFNLEDLEAALQYFESALEKDPDYALAHAGIGLVWHIYALAGIVPANEAAPKAVSAAERAVELDDTLAEVHYALAVIRYLMEWDWERAEASFRKAIDLNPNYPDARSYYANFLSLMHRPDEAIVQMERTLELDPFNSFFQTMHGAALLFMRHYDDAIEEFQKVLKIVPNHGAATDLLALTFHQKGMYEDAFEQMKAYYEAMDFKEGIKALTRGYENAGYQGAMRSAAELWEELAQVTYILPWNVAELYAYAGNKEKTLNWIEKGFELGDPNIGVIGIMPVFVDLLRDEPRYQDLLRKMNLPVEK